MKANATTIILRTVFKLMKTLFSTFLCSTPVFSTFQFHQDTTVDPKEVILKSTFKLTGVYYVNIVMAFVFLDITVAMKQLMTNDDSENTF